MRVGSRWVDGLRVHLVENDAGKAGRALALSLLTLLAATVAGMEGHASLEASRSSRLAEEIALAATGESSSSVIQVGAGYGIYRRWYEELELGGTTLRVFGAIGLDRSLDIHAIWPAGEGTP